MSVPHVVEPTPLFPGRPVENLTVRAADLLLDHLLTTDPGAHPDDPGAAIDAVQLAELRHRYAMNRHGLTRTWEQLSDDERGAAAIETWRWLSAARPIGFVP